MTTTLYPQLASSIPIFNALKPSLEPDIPTRPKSRTTLTALRRRRSSSFLFARIGVFACIVFAGILIGCLISPARLAAQETPAPAAQPASANPPAAQNPLAQMPNADAPPPQTKRILGLVPNFRAVNADEKLPPETVKEKFMDATQDSFDYSSIFLPAVIAGYNMATDATPEFRGGAAGYGRYFWHTAVDQTSENYWVEFIFPVVTREDSRYYTLGHGGFVKRTGYALSRAVITRSNSGAEVFNVSEIVGAGAAAGLSNAYYPSRERSLANTGSQWGLDVGVDAASFWFREFWPEINRSIFRDKYASPAAQP